jgi:hypothetical protein
MRRRAEWRSAHIDRVKLLYDFYHTDHGRRLHSHDHSEFAGQLPIPGSLDLSHINSFRRVIR